MCVCKVPRILVSKGEPETYGRTLDHQTSSCALRGPTRKHPLLRILAQANRKAMRTRQSSTPEVYAGTECDLICPLIDVFDQELIAIYE